jgi:hypothetical protein
LSDTSKGGLILAFTDAAQRSPAFGELGRGARRLRMRDA